MRAVIGHSSPYNGLMEDDGVTIGPQSRTTYTCVVGHRIAEHELDSKTEVQTLDRGARARLCREHGTPIAIEVTPSGNDRRG